MPIIRLQSEEERKKGIFYEFDPSQAPIGVGGMGEVYRGRCIKEHSPNNADSTDVAIKFMRFDVPQHVIMRARREATIQIKNENLVEMKAFIETTQRNVLGEIKRRYYVVSELLDGVTLDAVLKGNTTDCDGHEIPYAQKLYKDYTNDPSHFALFIVKNILSGIMALHNTGYIHRDIDPTNIMITKQGKIKLIDFGIAKQLSTLNSGDRDFGEDGKFLGKAQYAAPELVRGEINKQNKTTDIYAVGILLFQFLIGHPPFEGSQVEILEKQQKTAIPLDVVQQKEIRDIIAKATDKKQERRFQSAAEFLVAIEKAEYSDPEPSIASSVKNFISENRKILYAIPATVAMLILILTIKKVMPSNEMADNNSLTYEEAIRYLKSDEDSERSKGFKALDSLHDAGNYKATYLLSRLYFNPVLYNGENNRQEFLDKDILELKKATNVATDNAFAHRLLKEALAIDSTDYKSLFQIACDYRAGEIRTKIKDSHDFSKAKRYFEKALKLAKEGNDTAYINKIKEKLDDVEQRTILRP